MTNKEIFKIATSEDIQYYMNKINDLESNMCHKTDCEIKESKEEIKKYIFEIKELLK